MLSSKPLNQIFYPINSLIVLSPSLIPMLSMKSKPTYTKYLHYITDTQCNSN